ncbi:MAG: ATP-binding domain-containing protein, partial [Lachnospiraceae bacterium]|nr:ATP-binding domain-containing protein [Lachnospiraceae bacterium]
NVMIIHGVAGSGKTSIALHRVAFLLYRFSGRIKAEDIMILSPSKAFADYISDVIPELGEEPVREYSFYELAMDMLDNVIDFDDPEDPIDIADKGWQARARFKSDTAFLKLLDDYLEVLPERAFNAKTYRYDEAEVDADWIREQFLFYRYDPVLERIPTIADEVIEEYRYRGGLHKSREKRGAVVNRIRSMLSIRTPQALYRDFYRWLGRPDMLKMSGNRLEWPDVFPFLYLWHGYHGLPRHRNIRHLVVDEMQDYTPVEYAVLNIMYPCNKTILGDYGQCMNPWNASTLESLQAIYPEALCIELRKSYRSTAEIMNFARKISPGVQLDVIDRHGKEPEVYAFDTEEEELRFVAEKLRAFREGPHASLAVILKSGSAAAAYYEKLAPYAEDLTLLTPAATEFKSGALVTSVQMAKGLEFDEVIVPRSREYDREGFDRNLLYIACTRAMHELTLT